MKYFSTIYYLSKISHLLIKLREGMGDSNVTGGNAFEIKSNKMKAKESFISFLRLGEILSKEVNR